MFQSISFAIKTFMKIQRVGNTVITKATFVMTLCFSSWPASHCEQPLCAVVILKWLGSLEAYQPLWPLDESVTLLPWLKFGVKTIMATSRDSPAGY